MPVRTVLNVQFLEDVIWQIKLTRNELNERAGLSRSYLYKLLDEERSAGLTVDTLDRLHNAIEARMVELDIAPPDNLWGQLTIQVLVYAGAGEDVPDD